VKLDQGLSAVSKGRRGIERFGQRTDAADGNLVVGERSSLVLVALLCVERGRRVAGRCPRCSPVAESPFLIATVAPSSSFLDAWRSEKALEGDEKNDLFLPL